VWFWVTLAKPCGSRIGHEIWFWVSRKTHVVTGEPENPGFTGEPLKPSGCDVWCVELLKSVVNCCQEDELFVKTFGNVFE
jgi:hypothetical protein